MSHASLSVALLVDRPVLLSNREVIVVDELLAQLYNIGEKKKRRKREMRREGRGKGYLHVIFGECFNYEIGIVCCDLLEYILKINYITTLLPFSSPLSSPFSSLFLYLFGYISIPFLSNQEIQTIRCG